MEIPPEQSRLTLGNVSVRYKYTKDTSAMAKVKANMAGYQNHVLDVLSDMRENMAPIIGPIMKPREKAIPTRAIPLPRFFSSETSVMIAMLSDMFPLLKPPMKRARTNIWKFDDIAHNAYEQAMPT